MAMTPVEWIELYQSKLDEAKNWQADEHPLVREWVEDVILELEREIRSWAE